MVDSEVHVIELVRLYLAREGFEVTGATGAEEALELLQTGSPDLVVLETDLPDGSGTALLDELARGRESTFMVLTHTPSVAGRELAMAAGARSYLTKPFEPRDLVQSVKAAMAGSE